MVITKTASLDKNQGLNLLNSLFKQFQNCCNQPNPPHPSDLEKIFAHNFQISNNEEILSQNLNDYANYIRQLQKDFAHLEISSLRDEPLICGNRIAVQYDITANTHGGQKKQFCIMAIATIEDNKFTHWSQISHEKNTKHWKNH